MSVLPPKEIRVQLAVRLILLPFVLMGLSWVAARWFGMFAFVPMFFIGGVLTFWAIWPFVAWVAGGER